MKRLLASTTALSVAFAPLAGMPVFAQTMLEDGSVVAANGKVLCTPTPEAPCDLEAIVRSRAEARAAAKAAKEEAAAAEAAAAEAAAAEAAANDAAAAEAAAAEAAANDAAAAEAAAAEAAAAEAAAIEAAAAEAAAAEAAAIEAAAAEAAAAEAAAAEAALADEAAAQKAAEAAIAEQAAAEAAAAEAAADAEAEAAAVEAAAAEAAAKAAAGSADADAAEAAAQAAAELKAKRQARAAEVRAAKEAAAAEAAAAQAAADAAAEAVTAEESLAEQPATAETPVEAPVPEADAVAELEALLAAPTVTEEAAAAVDSTTSDTASDPAAPVVEEATNPLPLAARRAAAREARAARQAAAEADQPTSTTEPEASTEAEPDEEPTSVVERAVTEADTRSSDEEFVAAPTAVAGGKKSGLSDLEKVGLVALGALVVGAILSNNREVVQNTGDRVVVRDNDGRYVVYKDDDALLYRPGVNTSTESYRDGSTRTVVERPDGTQIVTIRDASGRVLRRAAYDALGREVVLIDDLVREEPIIVADLPRPRPSRLTISTNDRDAELKAELAELEAASLGRTFSLRQIREIREVRALAATIEVDSVTFDSGSSVIRSTEARKLADLGRIMGQLLERNPSEVFLIEGHTDAVGGAAMNLALSDRRAESVALALTEYFEIPPENLVVQGYGESELKVDTQNDERANRRANVRLITPLMRRASN